MSTGRGLFFRTLFALAIAAAGCGIAAAAQPLSYERIIASLGKVHDFDDVAIAPDGKTFAYADNTVHVAAVAAPHAARTFAACARCTGNSIAWSPDGRSIAFVATAPDGQADVAVADLASGAVRTITHAHGPLATPRWSPDGSRIAFLYSPGAPRAPSPLHPGTPDAGVVGSTIHEQRLAIVAAAGGPLRLLGPADLNVYEYDWSPDGARFVISAARGDGDANWWVAKLYTLASSGGPLQRIAAPLTQIASPRFSGDGTHVAYICGIMSDEAVTGGDVCVVPARGGTPVDVTSQLGASIATIDWRRTTTTILTTAYKRGEMCIITLDVAAQTQHVRWCAMQTLYANNYAGLISGDTGLALSRDGSMSAVIRQSFTAPPEIALGPVGAWKNVTAVNARVKLLIGPVHNFTWQSDGYTVQGYLIEPLTGRTRKSWPVITVVHGGPSYAVMPMFPGDLGEQTAMLSARGYALFLPNPRGSYGNGEAFTRADVKDFGYGDLRDIVSGVDAAARIAPLDRKRSGIMGWSYGGYMTMWALTQTQRFRAAVAGAGVSDWLSYYGTNGIDTWMIPFFGASVYDDPDVYARSSPINFIKHVRTPALMVGGTLDDEVPITQSYEYWHALRELHVPSELVVYPGEGHLFNRPADQLDLFRRVGAWFDRWMR